MTIGSNQANPSASFESVAAWVAAHNGHLPDPATEPDTWTAEWSGICPNCGHNQIAVVRLTVDPQWVGWQKPGDGGVGQCPCKQCGTPVAVWFQNAACGDRGPEHRSPTSSVE